MKNIRFIFAAVLGMMLAACSTDEIVQNSATNGAEGGNPMPFSATISTPAGTRGLTEVDGKSISAKWEVGEPIALIHGKTVDVLKVTSIDNEGVATIDGTINSATEGEDVHVVYIGTSTKGMDAFKTKLGTPAATITKTMIDNAVNQLWSAPQLGTLDAIDEGLDYRYASSTLTCPGSVFTFKTAVTPESRLAVWKLSLTDSNKKTLSTKELSIKDGNTTLLSVTAVVALSDFYVVLPALSGKNLTITAAVEPDTYTATKTGVTLNSGYFYQSAVQLAPVPYTSPNTFKVWNATTKKFEKVNLSSDDGVKTISSSTVGDFFKAEGMQAGKYIVEGSVSHTGNVMVGGPGTLELYLQDDASLTINGSLGASDIEGLKIASQAAGTGKLTVNATEGDGINAQKLTVDGGQVTVNTSAAESTTLVVNELVANNGSVTATNTGGACMNVNDDVTISVGDADVSLTGTNAAVTIAAGKTLSIKPAYNAAKGSIKAKATASGGKAISGGGTVKVRDRNDNITPLDLGNMKPESEIFF